MLCMLCELIATFSACIRSIKYEMYFSKPTFWFLGDYGVWNNPYLSPNPSLWSSCFPLPSPSLPPSFSSAALPLLSPVPVVSSQPGRRLKSEGLNSIKYSADIDFSQSLDSPPLPPSCFLSRLFLKPSLFPLLAAVTNEVLCCAQTNKRSHRQPRTYAHGES